MLDDLAALAALARAGTMTRAATSLRVSQSAVSKRIASLEDRVGVDLVEPDGRRVRLTAAGERLLSRTSPLVAELRRALEIEDESGAGELVIGVSEAILASFGPELLAEVGRALPEMRLTVHTHRSPVAIDRVRSGEYALAIVAGSIGGGDAIVRELGREEMVLVASAGARPRLRRGCTLDVITIEPASATWKSIEAGVAELSSATGVVLRPTATLESFAGVVQLARAGFGVGLAPRGIAAALCDRSEIVRLPRPGLHRPLWVHHRKSATSRPLVTAFLAALDRSVARRRALRTPHRAAPRAATKR